MPKSPCSRNRRSFPLPTGLIYPSTAKKPTEVNAIKGTTLQFIGNKFQCFVRTHSGAGGMGQGAQINSSKEGGKLNIAVAWIADPTEYERV